MRVHVELSANPLVDYWGFCKAIAQTVCPTGEQGLEGIDCIVGKTVKHNVPMEQPAGNGHWPFQGGLQSVLISDDGHTLDQLSQVQDAANERDALELPLSQPARAHREIVELTLPYRLTDDDLRVLEKLLPDLPALRYPISEGEAAEFMDAYFSLKDRPAWEPVLVTAHTIERRKAEQDAYMHDQQRLLQKEFVEGRLVAVDSRHVPVAVLSVGYYIPREQAVSYLNRVGIPWRDQETAAGLIVPEAREPETHPAPPVAPVEVKGKVGGRKLTDEQRRAVVEFFDKLSLDKDVNNPNMQTAERFNISGRYVRVLVSAAKAAEAAAALAAAEAEKESRIDFLIASGKK